VYSPITIGMRVLRPSRVGSDKVKVTNMAGPLAKARLEGKIKITIDSDQRTTGRFASQINWTC